MKKILVFVLIGALISCQSSKSLPLDYRETPVPTGNEYCVEAEKHLKELCNANMEENLYCCQAVSSTKRGKSFTQFCQETQNAGIALDPKCLSEITNCASIDKCLGTSR